MTLWQVSKYSARIERKEFVRRTDRFAFDEDGNRQKLDSEYARLFEDREEALDYAGTLLTQKLGKAIRAMGESVWAAISAFEKWENGR